jgi:hypothetical protein
MLRELAEATDIVLPDVPAFFSFREIGRFVRTHGPVTGLENNTGNDQH